MDHIYLHFVYCNTLDDQISQIKNIDNHWEEFIFGDQVWILQSYLILKKYFKNISLGREPKEGCINIIHGGNVGQSKLSGRYYFVNTRADKEASLWVNFEIVQNKLQKHPKSQFIPHWPQPGLIRRKSDKSQINRIAFLGAKEQNILRFYPVEQDMKNLGITYISLDRNNWNDYSNIDLALAIRQFGKSKKYDNKPPSKLINAWWAEVPLIASNDIAYSQIGTPGKDYVVVEKYEEFLREIELLKVNHVHYRNIVENGIKKRAQYSRENITNQWIELVKQVIYPDFLAWSKKKGIDNLMDVFFRRIVIKHPIFTEKFFSFGKCFNDS